MVLAEIEEILNLVQISQFSEVLKILEERIRIFSIFLFWSWLLTVGDQESYDFYCWRPAAQNGRALVLFKVMTKYGRPSAKEHQKW